MPEGCSKYQSMSGAYPRNGFASLDEAVKEGRWIIFVGHDIGKRGYWVTAALEALCESLQGPAHGIWLGRSEEHTSELQSRLHLVCRLLLEKKKTYPFSTHLHHPH